MTKIMIMGLAAAAVACGGGQKKPASEADLDSELDRSPMAKEAEIPRQEAYAEVRAVGGGKATGFIILYQIDGREEPVHIQIKARGLAKGGIHGMHIHEGASCSDPGSFFNPGKDPLGGFFEPAHHAGALESIAADAEGKFEGEVTPSPAITLLQGDSYIIGRTLVIYEKDNDFSKDEKTGGLGKPVACGVIVHGTLPAQAPPKSK